MLFGNNEWASSNDAKFEIAFGNVHVNFTHWMVTKDPIPEVPDSQLLANLWAQGGALQCCFNQEGIDLLIPIYFGSIKADVVFDPACLSVTLYQVKFKVAGDKKAESVIRPIDIPRDLHQPLPYFAILMELGNESNYQETGSKAKSTACNPIGDGEFKELLSQFTAAVGALYSGQDQARRKKQKKNKKKQSKKMEQLKEDVTESKLAMDSYN
ncbi:hypothetical protein BU17DRAFT_88496 [Hysterangium stoloniferum]|nr:hypothetical protein BU17DRAFT_88496 [Hysterangium stoloniferum]